jgi:hypothetical protein
VTSPQQRGTPDRVVDGGVEDMVVRVFSSPDEARAWLADATLAD